MSAPAIASITFDKASYSPGQTITATVNYTPGTSPSSQTLTVVGTDPTTNQAAQLTATFVVNKNDSTTWSLSDPGNRTWTKVSDNGSVAVFTATA